MLALWSGCVKDRPVLPGCCFLQVVPKAATLRLKGSSFRYCGFQKCTLQFKDAAATLNFRHWRNSWDGKTFRGQQDWETWCNGCTMPGYPGLAKEGVSLHLPKHGSLRECIFSCVWGIMSSRLLLCFGLLRSEELVKTTFNFIFVRILSQRTPSKFCDISTDKRCLYF